METVRRYKRGNKCAIRLELAEKLEVSRGLSFKQIAHALEMSQETILSKSRKGDIIVVRQIITAYFHSVGMTLEECGRVFDFNHSTVVHSCKKVLDMLEIKDSVYCGYIEKMRNLSPNTKTELDLINSLYVKHFLQGNNEAFNEKTRKRYAWVVSAIEDAYKNGKQIERQNRFRYKRN